MHRRRSSAKPDSRENNVRIDFGGLRHLSDMTMGEILRSKEVLGLYYAIGWLTVFLSMGGASAMHDRARFE